MKLDIKRRKMLGPKAETKIKLMIEDRRQSCCCCCCCSVISNFVIALNFSVDYSSYPSILKLQGCICICVAVYLADAFCEWG